MLQTAVPILSHKQPLSLPYHDEHGASWHYRVQSWQLGQDGITCFGIVFKHLHRLIKERFGDVLEDSWDGSLDDG